MQTSRRPLLADDPLTSRASPSVQFAILASFSTVYAGLLPQNQEINGSIITKATMLRILMPLGYNTQLYRKGVTKERERDLYAGVPTGRGKLISYLQVL